MQRSMCILGALSEHLQPATVQCCTQNCDILQQLVFQEYAEDQQNRSAQDLGMRMVMLYGVCDIFVSRALIGCPWLAGWVRGWVGGCFFTAWFMKRHMNTACAPGSNRGARAFSLDRSMVDREERFD